MSEVISMPKFSVLETARWAGIYKSRVGFKHEGKEMKYSKPVIVAQNSAQGSFAAGCPTASRSKGCTACELKQ
jgi:hypothetical protein